MVRSSISNAFRSRTVVTSDEAAILDLRRFSANLGRNRLLIQANSGNTSIKSGDRMWIKASGTWLQDAGQEDMFVSVPLADVEASMDRRVELRSPYQTSEGKALRASVETAMHAVLPYRVAAHVHSVNTIAWAVRQDAPLQLSKILRGLRWEWVGYVPSGWRLALEIERALKRSPGADVFVLGNHGLVICGNSCEEAEALLLEVERRLSLRPRPAPEPDWSVLQTYTNSPHWHLPQAATVHALAMDERTRGIWSQGFLYPCQILYLGDMARVAAGTTPGYSTGNAPFLVLDGAGVLLSETITKVEQEMLAGFAEVMQRIDPAADLRYLTAKECEEVESSNVYSR